MPGCVSDGGTEQEAKANVKLALIDFIYFLLEDELPIPAPKLLDKHIIIKLSDNEDSLSGKRARAYKSLTLGWGNSESGTTPSGFGRRVYIA